MSTEVKILRINAAISSINPLQIAVEPAVDPDLNIKMWGGQDDAGAVTKFLGKDKPIRVTSVAINGTDELLPQALVIPAGSDTASLVPVVDDPDTDVGAVDPIPSKACVASMVVGSVNAAAGILPVFSTIADMRAVTGSSGAVCICTDSAFSRPVRFTWMSPAWRVDPGQTIVLVQNVFPRSTVTNTSKNVLAGLTLPNGLFVSGDEFGVFFNSSSTAPATVALSTNDNDVLAGTLALSVSNTGLVFESSSKFSVLNRYSHVVKDISVQSASATVIAIYDGFYYYWLSGQIKKVELSTGTTTTIVSDTSSALFSVNAMCVDGDGLYLFGANFGTSRIVKYTHAGVSSVLHTFSGYNFSINAYALCAYNNFIYLATGTSLTYNTQVGSLFRLSTSDTTSLLLSSETTAGAVSCNTQRVYFTRSSNSSVYSVLHDGTDLTTFIATTGVNGGAILVFGNTLLFRGSQTVSTTYKLSDGSTLGAVITAKSFNIPVKHGDVGLMTLGGSNIRLSTITESALDVFASSLGAPLTPSPVDAYADTELNLHYTLSTQPATFGIQSLVLRTL